MIQILIFCQFTPVHFGAQILKPGHLLEEASLISAEDVLSPVLSDGALMKAKLQHER